MRRRLHRKPTPEQLEGWLKYASKAATSANRLARAAGVHGQMVEEALGHPLEDIAWKYPELASHLNALNKAFSSHISKVVNEIARLYKRHAATLAGMPKDRLLTGTLRELHVWMSRLKPPAVEFVIAAGLMAASTAVGVLAGPTKTKAETGQEPTPAVPPEDADTAKTKTPAEAVIEEWAERTKTGTELPNQPVVKV